MISENLQSRLGKIITVSKNDELPEFDDFIIPGLESGDVGIVAAPGGTGKSFLLLEIAFSVALGQTLLKGLVVRNAGRVRLLNFEEKEKTLRHRMIWVCRNFKCEFPAENIFVSSLSNCTFPLLGKSGEINTEYVDILKKQADGMSLLILDPLRMCHQSDENDAGAMSTLVQVLKDVGETTGAGVLVAHHSSKASILSGQGNTQQSVRGSSALVDAARLVITLSKPKDVDSNLLELSWVKINSHPPIETVSLSRSAGGVLVSTGIDFCNREIEKNSCIKSAEPVQSQLGGMDCSREYELGRHKGVK